LGGVSLVGGAGGGGGGGGGVLWGGGVGRRVGRDVAFRTEGGRCFCSVGGRSLRAGWRFLRSGIVLGGGVLRRRGWGVGRFWFFLGAGGAGVGGFFRVGGSCDFLSVGGAGSVRVCGVCWGGFFGLGFGLGGWVGGGCCSVPLLDFFSSTSDVSELSLPSSQNTTSFLPTLALCCTVSPRNPPPLV